MKLFTGWVLTAGLVVAAGVAQAQVLAPYDAGRSPYRMVSDFGGPYAALPPAYYGPRLLPPEEVYTVLRENGFSTLGIPRQRGLVYTISVIGRGGADGRLVIDARTGRILRFLPAGRIGEHDDALTTYGPPPPVTATRDDPRLPRSNPKVASRTPVPLPKTAPLSGGPKPLAANPTTAPAQPSISAQAKPAEQQTTQAAVPPAAAPVEAKPTPQILPTQNMPKAQGLE